MFYIFFYYYISRKIYIAIDLFFLSYLLFLSAHENKFECSKFSYNKRLLLKYIILFKINKQKKLVSNNLF